jgi:hypothetical protein
MNKEQALNKLAALEAETKALRAIIEAPDKPAVPVRWKPEGDEFFWAINAFGESARVCMSPTREAYGNCFQTREHGEIAAKAVSQTLKVCAAAFAVDPDAGNFGSALRWTVVKRETIPTEYRWKPTSHEFAPGVVVFVHTFEQAEQMAAILNAEGV